MKSKKLIIAIKDGIVESDDSPCPERRWHIYETDLKVTETK